MENHTINEMKTSYFLCMEESTLLHFINNRSKMTNQRQAFKKSRWDAMTELKYESLCGVSFCIVSLGSSNEAVRISWSLRFFGPADMMFRNQDLASSACCSPCSLCKTEKTNKILAQMFHKVEPQQNIKPSPFIRCSCNKENYMYLNT